MLWIGVLKYFIFGSKVALSVWTITFAILSIVPDSSLLLETWIKLYFSYIIVWKLVHYLAPCYHKISYSISIYPIFVHISYVNIFWKWWMLIIDTLYISRYQRVIWHPLISRYSHNTRKCASGCANTSVPTPSLMHTMKKIQHILHICNKGINILLAAIVFPLSEYPFVMRCHCVSPWDTDDVHNFLLKATISNWFLDKCIARSRSLGNSGCNLFSWSASVNVAFFCERMIGSSTSDWVIIGNQYWVDQHGITMIPDAFSQMILKIYFPTRLKAGNA